MRKKKDKTNDFKEYFAGTKFVQKIETLLSCFMKVTLSNNGVNFISKTTVIRRKFVPQANSKFE